MARAVWQESSSRKTNNSQAHGLLHQAIINGPLAAEELRQSSLLPSGGWILVVISRWRNSRNLPKKTWAVQMSSSSLLTPSVSGTQWGTQRIAQEPFIVCHAILSWSRPFSSNCQVPSLPRCSSRPSLRYAKHGNRGSEWPPSRIVGHPKSYDTVRFGFQVFFRVTGHQTLEVAASAKHIMNLSNQLCS